MNPAYAIRLPRHARAVLTALTLAPAPLRAQDPVAVNLFVADVTYDGGVAQLGPPRKLTGDRGVSSQPAFTPDGSAILFVGRRGGPDAQSDVYRVDLATGAETQITATPEMENSPTVTPDGRLMVIRWVPATLFTEWGPWIYDMNGTPLRGVLPGPDTVGYYVRVDSVTYAMVRPKARNAVAVFDVRAGTMMDRDWIVANLPPQLIPGQRAVSYTRPDPSGRNVIRRLDISTGDTSTIAPALTGRTVHAWTPGGAILMGRGNRVYQLSPARDREWRQIAAFDDPALQSVSTYALSPDGRRVVLISPLKPALHTVLRDSIQEGRTMQHAIASLGQGDAWLARLEVAEGPLVALARERQAQGAAGDAVALLELVTRLEPSSYSAQLALGAARTASGDETGAVAAYRKSLSLNPRKTDAEKRDAERAEAALGERR